MKKTPRCYKMIYINCTFGMIPTIWYQQGIIRDDTSKYALLRYEKEQKIKTDTNYTSYDDSNFDSKEQVRDLVILMSNKHTFPLNIRNIVKKARDKMGWVLWVFQCLLKSLVIPLLEYCCQFRLDETRGLFGLLLQFLIHLLVYDFIRLKNTNWDWFIHNYR